MAQQTPNYNDDYNYPSLNRKDLMYLSTLSNRDFPIRKINKINTKRDWSVNLYNLDIDRAVPRRTNVFTNKVDFINKIDDIDKARPKPDKIWKHPDYILNCRDIEKAYPKKINVFTQRKVNPLEPVYMLPKPKPTSPIPPPKFIRDQINISDIAGSHPRPLLHGNIRPPFEDVKDSHPKKAYERKVLHNSLDFRDVSNSNFHYDNYQVKRNENQFKEKVYEDIEGSRPQGFSRFKDRGMRYMSNDDIKGTLPGSMNRYALFSCDRSSLYSSADIDGAKAGTLKKGITTKRCTNPLMPQYEYLGNSENLDCYGITTSNPKRENKRYEICKGEQCNVGNYRRFDKVTSQSCNNIFYPPTVKEETQNKDSNKPVDWDTLPCFNDVPQFDKEKYKKPVPNHEYVHNNELFFGKKNDNARLDVQRQKALALPNSGENYLKLFKSRSCDNIKNQPLNDTKYKNDLLVKNDPLYNKLNKSPCYEKQMDYFLKDNAYNVM